MILSPVRIGGGGGGSGEINSGVNIGASGVGVFVDKSGVDLRFARLNALSPRVTVAISGTQIDFDVVNSAFSVTGHTHAQADVTDLVTALAARQIEPATTGFVVRSVAGTGIARSLSPGTGIGITNVDGAAGNPTISVTAIAQSDVTNLVTALATKVATGTSVGASGIAVYDSISGSELKLRRLNPNDARVLIAVSGSQIDFSLSTSAFATTAGSAQLNASGRVPASQLGFAGGASGAFVFLNEAGNYVTAPGAGGGEANIGENLGASGIGIYLQKSGVALQFAKLNPFTNQISVALSGSQIDLDVVENNISLQNLTGKATGSQHSFDFTSSFVGTRISLTANAYQTGPQVNIDSGTWMVWGHVTIRSNTATANRATAKLWDGSANPIASTEGAAPSQGTNTRGYISLSIPGVVISQTTTATWAISVATVGGSSDIEAVPGDNAPTGTAASKIYALRIG